MFKSKGYVDDGVRLLRGDNIVQGALRWDGVKRWPEDQATEHDRYELEPGDVVLAMDRPWIEAGLKYAAVTEHDLPALLVQRVARLRGRESLYSGFLRYLIGSHDFTAYVLAVQTGSAVPHISGGQILDFEFSLPPLSEQRAIAEVLGSLDDKIELNRRMNRTLESMARALFKSWFVDFDPVHANAAGKPTLSADLAALFPAGFEPSRHGDIPEGWEVRQVGDILHPEIGGQWGTEVRAEGLVEAVCLRGCDMEDLRSAGWSHRAPTRYIKANALEKRRLRDSDLLIAASGAGPCGRPLWASPELQGMHSAPVIYSNFVKRFSTPSRSHAIYLDRFFQEKFLDRSICDFITGTSVPNLDANGMLAGLNIVVPEKKSWRLSRQCASRCSSDSILPRT